MGILVIDDDPIFLSTVKRIAKHMKIHVTACGSLSELLRVEKGGGYDAAIVDYYLDDVKKHLRGTDIASMLGATPVMLVSASDKCLQESDTWPATVRSFMCKDLGARAILHTAKELGGPKL
jgi:DNA-binding response OmpR family regulator